jgi:hypothetical protein
VVDHILSSRLVVANFGTDEFFNPSRLQALCSGCHNVKTIGESQWTGKKGTKLDRLTDRTNTTVVCGQAGSGKTTYVEQRKVANDLVWDYDEVMARITGLPLYETLEGAIGSVLADRDAFITSTAYSQHHVWLIVANRHAHIVKLLEEAGATVIELTTPDEVCKQRIKDRLSTVNK